MKQKELTKTFMMISNLKKPFGFSSYTKIFQCFNPYNSAITLYKSCRTNVFFFQFEIIMSQLHVALSALFEYLCYGSTAKV